MVDLSEALKQTQSWTHEEARAAYDQLSDIVEEWQGIPVPLPDLQLRLHDRHPLAPVLNEYEEGRDGVEMQIMVGGPSYDDNEDEVIVNQWYSRQLNCDVYVYQRRPSRRAFVIKVPRSHSMTKLMFWLRTIGASDAWDENAELKAREKLRSMLTQRQWRHYDLTGSFFETSKRSRLVYVFRRSRPTIAMTSRWQWYRKDPPDSMKCLAVLCMHPIGYYDQSWAGCLVPSDDVIAHLLMMRSDEAGFWKAANEHEVWRPEAGL